MNKSLILLFLFSLNIQTITAAPKTVKKEISVYTFDYLGDMRKIYLSNGGSGDELHEVGLSIANIRGPFTTVLDDQSRVSLRKRVRDPTNPESWIYPPMTHVSIPSSIQKPLLILFPSSKEKVYKALVIDSAFSSFPKGTYKMINFTPKDVRGLVGKTKVVAPSKKIVSFDPTKNSEDNLNVHFQYKRTNDWKSFGMTRWSNNKEKRSLLCVIQDPDTKRFRIKGIPLR